MRSSEEGDRGKIKIVKYYAWTLCRGVWNWRLLLPCCALLGCGGGCAGTVTDYSGLWCQKAEKMSWHLAHSGSAVSCFWVCGVISILIFSFDQAQCDMRVVWGPVAIQCRGKGLPHAYCICCGCLWSGKALPAYCVELLYQAHKHDWCDRIVWDKCAVLPGCHGMNCPLDIHNHTSWSIVPSFPLLFWSCWAREVVEREVARAQLTALVLSLYGHKKCMRWCDSSRLECQMRQCQHS